MTGTKPQPIEAVNIFGEPITLQPLHGKSYIEPRGYAGIPGTGPAGETCGTCAHAVREKRSAKSWIKCDKNRANWTGGRATDILAGTAACNKWEAEEP
jgi:hypothetical protein